MKKISRDKMGPALHLLFGMCLGSTEKQTDVVAAFRRAGTSPEYPDHLRTAFGAMAQAVQYLSEGYGIPTGREREKLISLGIETAARVDATLAAMPGAGDDFPAKADAAFAAYIAAKKAPALVS